MYEFRHVLGLFFLFKNYFLYFGYKRNKTKNPVLIELQYNMGTVYKVKQKNNLVNMIKKTVKKNMPGGRIEKMSRLTWKRK